MRTRAQKRAIFAYERTKDLQTKQVLPEVRDEYRTLVLGLGPSVLRNGLVTALALLQRKAKDHPEKGKDAATWLLEHVARSNVPGLGVDATHAGELLCERARDLDLEGTMLATRELLQVVEWLKRAVEATFE